jgi:hypothetical protein
MTAETGLLQKPSPTNSTRPNSILKLVRLCVAHKLVYASQAYLQPAENNVYSEELLVKKSLLMLYQICYNSQYLVDRVIL